jgi:hypothetical protein
MSTPSNLYAEKVFAEHPRVLWALDDTVDYISLISEQQRVPSTWSFYESVGSVSTDSVDQPFQSSPLIKIVGDSPSGNYETAKAVGPDLFNFTSLNSQLETFSVGSYIYSYTPYLTGVDIGYEYFDATTGSLVQNLKHYDISISEKWFFVSETFQIPTDSSQMRPVINITYLKSTTPAEEYSFLINGVTVGQWSEEFNSFSLGVHQQSIPSTINLQNLTGIEAKAYGLLENSGYYILNGSSLCSKNSGIPMVYGSSNTTIISPNSNGKPSLIIPGNGFLNTDGKFSEYTLEMWLRINSSSPTLKRIFGPISSDDGIYVNGPFITLKISDNVGSFCVGEWTRPMLVHIRIAKNTASLLINGEEVISLSFITSNLSFPNKETNGKSNDWLGFYGHSDVTPIEVDCVGLYSYQVPLIMAKRRFVYGQGVEIPENINSAYSGTSVFIDYPFANYANNYLYPDIGMWSQGILDNLSVKNNFLSLPEYKLPLFISNNKTLIDFNSDNALIQNESDKLFSLRPNANWLSTESCLVFDTINPINDFASSVFGVFKYTQSSQPTQVLIRIEDQLTGNYVSVNLVENHVEYTVKHGTSQPELLYRSLGIAGGEIFSAGVNFEKFSTYYGGTVAELLGNRGSLKVYIGGTKELSDTFSGKIYKIGFDNPTNFAKVSSLFANNGTPQEYKEIYNYADAGIYDAGYAYFGNQGSYYNNLDEFIEGNSDFWEYYLSGGVISSYATLELNEHFPSYGLVGTVNFSKFSLDIDVASSWEDNIPLTYFAKYTTDSKGKEKYGLDFLQFNINYPAPLSYIESAEYTSWDYSELLSRYEIPVQRSYASLDNHLYTGYNNYSDLLTKSLKTYNLDTSKSLVRSYVSFQYTSEGANKSSNSFEYSVKPESNEIVKPGTYVVGIDSNSDPIRDSFINTKYEVVDGSIIYPPSGIDFNKLSVVIHLDFNVNQILKNPLEIKSLQLASQALNSSANEIGTRFGTSLYPYKRSGIYYDYKTDNPFRIYKGSSPYLYLTRNSGIEVKGTFDPLVNRGLAIPINKSMSNDYKVMAMQIALRYDQSFFPYAPTQIFEIESKNGNIKFFMVADSPSGQRAKIYAINENTGELEDGIVFYLNGNIVNDPVITTKEWAFLGISFSNLLNFNSFVGSLRINGPLLVNLISTYKSTNLQEVQTVTTRPWFKVKYEGPLTLNWDFWDVAYKWQGVLVISSTSYYGANPGDIYKAYSGTNKIIVDDYNASDANPKILSFKQYEYNFYSEVEWQSSTQNAV